MSEPEGAPKRFLPVTLLLPHTVPHGGGTKLLVGDYDLTHLVRAVTVESRVGQVTKVAIELIPELVDVQLGEAEVHATLQSLVDGATHLVAITSLADACERWDRPPGDGASGG